MWVQILNNVVFPVLFTVLFGLLVLIIRFLNSKTSYQRALSSPTTQHRFSQEDIHENLKEVLRIIEILQTKTMGGENIDNEKVTVERKNAACFLHCFQLVVREENLSHLHYQAISQVSEENWRISVWPALHSLGRGVVYDHGSY